MAVLMFLKSQTLADLEVDKSSLNIVRKNYFCYVSFGRKAFKVRLKFSSLKVLIKLNRRKYKEQRCSINAKG